MRHYLRLCLTQKLQSRTAQTATLRTKMTKMCFLLLLLICSLCTAQLQTETDNEIIQLGVNTEPTHASDHQRTLTQDIDAVLRKMNDSLAEQRLEIRLLQRENAAQAAKLRQLELQRTEVNRLRQQLRGNRVAFSASMLASDSGTFYGPFNAQTTLVFRNVFTNIGNAYNQYTGVFTAPVRGAYHFEFFIGARAHGPPTAAVLVKNREAICIAYEHHRSYFESSANGVTLLLGVGDVVFLRLWQGSWVFDNINRHNTFSGHLLFTM